MELYEPEIPSELSSVPELVQFVVSENRRIAAALAGALPSTLVELNAAPTRLREFMIVAADGTNWDPGSGRGVYAYYSGAWHKLG